MDQVVKIYAGGVQFDVDWVTNHGDFLWSSSVLPAKCEDNTSRRSRPLTNVPSHVKNGSPKHECVDTFNSAEGTWEEERGGKHNFECRCVKRKCKS
jgi:hypothetical protein